MHPARWLNQLRDSVRRVTRPRTPRTEPSKVDFEPYGIRWRTDRDPFMQESMGDPASTWDFYIRDAEGWPAAVCVDFQYASSAPRQTAPVLYAAALPMRFRGAHGMGTHHAGQRLAPLEQKLHTSLSDHQGFPVGRLRTRGEWRIYAYGPESLPWHTLLSGVEAELEAPITPAQRYDPTWAWYRRALLPNPERMQWICDRHVVGALQRRGDEAGVARAVDHCAAFQSPLDRDAFIRSAQERGFICELESNEAAPYIARLRRNDPVTLHHIHAVVMELVYLAAVHDGAYDGWGAPVTRTNTTTT